MGLAQHRCSTVVHVPAIAYQWASLELTMPVGAAGQLQSICTAAGSTGAWTSLCWELRTRQRSLLWLAGLAGLQATQMSFEA